MPVTSHKTIILQTANCENGTLRNFHLSKNVELRTKEGNYLKSMHCKRLENTPWNVIDKYLIRVHMSICRLNDISRR